MSSPHEAEIQDLLAEREDINRQFALVEADTATRKAQLARLQSTRSSLYSDAARKDGELMAINRQAQATMKVRLSEIKDRLRELARDKALPITFHVAFVRAAKELLSAKAFKKLEEAANATVKNAA